MPSISEAKSCCPVCLSSSVQTTEIASAVSRSTGGFTNITHSDSAIHFSCSRCGEFVVSLCDCVNLKSPRIRSEWNPTHLSALLREQTVRGLPRFWLRCGMEPYGPLDWEGALAPIEVEELLRRWPRSIPERLDRYLCNLGSMSPNGGYRVQISTAEIAIPFAETTDEAWYNTRALVQQQLVEQHATAPGQQVWLTPQGWARVEELTERKSARENPVFVAMWFGGVDQRQVMDGAFADGIQQAIEDAGYRATRADLVEHNDWIMDKVLGDIRIAPFVVADFTEHRNGVYLEAGFARGLGIPVIHTCRADHLSNAHFDTAQLNHVVWNSPEDLRTKLYHRIMGTIGQGPHWQAS